MPWRAPADFDRVGRSLVFQRSLAVACESGTLKKMMCNTTAAHKVWAKTGTLAHSKQLAGFTVDGKGRRVTFSIICNGVSSISAATKAINSVMVLLRGYTR